MSNVTEEQAPLGRLGARLERLLATYRSALHADEARLHAAMRDYEASLIPAHLRKVA